MLTGFSPRKNDLTLYIMPGFARYEDLMARLGAPAPYAWSRLTYGRAATRLMRLA